MNKNSNSAERLKMLMAEMRINQTDIVKKTGLAKSAISQYVNGQREPRQDAIGIICQSYGINPTWFMGYDAPMFLLIKNAALNFEEEKLINLFRNAEESYQQDVIDLLKKHQKKEAHSKSSKEA